MTTREVLLNGIEETTISPPIAIDETQPERELLLIEKEMELWRDSYQTLKIRYDVAKALGDSEGKTAYRKEMERHQKAYNHLLKRHAEISAKIEGEPK